MGASNFIACFNETESFEGGYVNNSHDPGGATLKGVTQAVYTAYLVHHGRPNAPVRGASDVDIQTIYRTQYWNAVHGDDLYDGLDLVMVDTAWGSGPVEAIKFLQRAIKVKDDGQLGLLTLAALKPFYNSTSLLEQICSEREAFFRSLPTWSYFGKGWLVRLNGVHAKCLAMNKAALGSAAPPVPSSSGVAKKETTMTTQAPVVTQVAAASAPKVAPPVKLDYVDWLSQMIETIEPEIELGAEALASLAAASVPGGSIILDIFGKKMVGQAVAQGAATLEALVSTKAVTVVASNALETAAFNIINSAAPKVANLFGPKLTTWISAEIAQLTKK